jgi:hypothetical protein
VCCFSPLLFLSSNSKEKDSSSDKESLSKQCLTTSNEDEKVVERGEGRLPRKFLKPSFRRPLH